MELRVAGAQMNPVVGDIGGNAGRIVDAVDWATAAGADVLLLPELALTGYPPEDLLLRGSFVDDNLEALRDVAARTGDTAVVVGFVDTVEDGEREDSRPRNLANAAAVLARGAVHGVYHKILLPNYGVFDEARYFAAGIRPDILFEIAGIACGVSVCEDIWDPAGPPARQAAAGARILLNINGSPYHQGKSRERTALLAAEARRSGVPVVYLNMVGGQDELVFDGDSMIFDASGTVLHRASRFTEDRFVVDVEVGGGPVPDRALHVSSARGALPALEPPVSHQALDETEEVYSALVSGLGDYVRKNGFTEVLIGFSGGIDSALAAAIAVDALGPDGVWGVTMPSRYSSEGSWADSLRLATNLGCRCDIVPIEDVFSGYLSTLEPQFAGTPEGIAEENLQARIRGAILMALSNKFGPMVVATGNKSEMAVGYATLYGDMAGGYAVLKDVFKTQVYRLARWRNRDGEVIPQAIIDKEPSAELRHDQRDTDSLPGYDLLDRILERYVEQDHSTDDIVADGFDPEMVRRVSRMVDVNEYKRRQSAPGTRITTKAFGKDRRLPITNRYDARRNAGAR